MSNQSKNEYAEIAGVRLTHPDRVLYPEQQVTKRELAKFYVDVEQWILPHAAGRPLSVVRCPQGRAVQCFYQKHVSEGLPEAIEGVRIKEKEGEGTYIMIEDLAGLISLVQIGVLEIHPWGSRADKVDSPDIMIFDLDPGEGVSWKDVVDGARLMHERLAQLGLKSYVKTSGGKGLHVVTPLMRRSDWDELKDFAKAVADNVVAQDPEKYIATMSKEKRKGKIFIDYLRNSRGATSVAAYSTRARKGAPVSTPLRWDELSPQLKPDAFTIANIKKRLASLKRDPWEKFFEVQQSITTDMLHEVGA